MFIVKIRTLFNVSSTKTNEFSVKRVISVMFNEYWLKFLFLASCKALVESVRYCDAAVLYSLRAASTSLVKSSTAATEKVKNLVSLRHVVLYLFN